jgi:hypothetical protein
MDNLFILRGIHTPPFASEFSLVIPPGCDHSPREILPVEVPPIFSLYSFSP